MGTKTGNAKAAIFQTPAKLLTIQRPVPRGTSPRLRKPNFQVHDGETNTVEPEEREIEIMHPREIPLPDIPDEDIWAQDRKYTQLEGKNFTKDWAMYFCNDDNESFDSKLKRFEEAEARLGRVQAASGLAFADAQ